MIPFTMPLLVKAIYPPLVVLIGFILARSIERLDDRSVAAGCLFGFAPIFLFHQAHGQALREYSLTLIFFFILFHTVVLYLLSSQALYWMNVSIRNRHLFLLNILMISTFTLQGVQPYVGAPALAVQSVNILLFYHLLLLALLGIYLSADHPGFYQNLYSVFKTPLLFAIIAGFLFSAFQVDLGFEVMTVVDSLVDTTLHLALLVTGIVFGRYVFFLQVREYAVLGWGILFCVAGRLVVSPLLAMLIVKMMGIEDVALQRAMILSSGVPTGAFAAVLISYYGRANEKRFTVLCIVATTLASFISLPLLIRLLDLWFPLGVKA